MTTPKYRWTVTMSIIIMLGSRIAADELKHSKIGTLRRLQESTESTNDCIIDGVNYCPPTDIDVPVGLLTPVSAPTDGSTSAPTLSPSNSIPTTPPPTPPSSDLATSNPVNTNSPSNNGAQDRPSDPPSLVPSAILPQTSPPTITQIPSMLPSLSPTKEPTEPPTASPSAVPSTIPTAPPTGAPSNGPSISAAPSMDADSYDTRIHVGENGFPRAVSVCRRNIPALATNVTNQLIVFDYIMNIVPGSSPSLSMSTITMRLHNALAEKHLLCVYNSESSTLYTSRISTNPADVLSNGTCTSAQRLANNECYRVNGAFSIQTFYFQTQESNPSESRRLVAATENSTIIRDENVLDSYSSSLQEIFASGLFVTVNIASTTFLGVTNAVAVKTNDSGVIAGSVVGSLVAICLIGGLAFFAAKSHRRRQWAEEIKDQHSLSLYEDQSHTESAEVLTRDGEDDDVNGHRPVTLSDAENRNEMDRLEILAKAPVKKTTNARLPQHASEEQALDELVARTMLSRVKRDLGPRVAPASPRRYDIDDTVDL